MNSTMRIGISSQPKSRALKRGIGWLLRGMTVKLVDLLFWRPRCVDCKHRYRILAYGTCWDCSMKAIERRIWIPLLRAFAQALTDPRVAFVTRLHLRERKVDQPTKD
jgi:hypothetical protein